MVFYRIKNWAEFYERGHRADREVVFRWVALPTKHDGKSFRRLARHSKSVSVFCAFVLMVETAAKMPVRGELRDEDGPLSAKDLSDSTGFPESIFASAFEALTDESIEICWLERVECPELSGLVATTPATGQDRTVQEKTKARAHYGGNGKNGKRKPLDSDAIRRAAVAATGGRS
jgi:hypothetical protein